MTLPLIGISTQQRPLTKDRVICNISGTYVQAVILAGGLPLLIPIGLSHADFSQVFSRLDGLLLTGGPDIDPSRYGAAMHPEVKGVDVQRDEMDTRLVHFALEKQIPILGICRGIQMLNVASGGTLHTHVIDQHPNALFHTSYPDMPYDYLTHSIQITHGSMLAEIIGDLTVQVNSLHHQGIKDLGANLRPVGLAPDGLVEAVEVNGHPFGLGVQWHPELLLEHAPMRALFAALVRAAAARI